MNTAARISALCGVLFFLIYAYQLVYIPVGIWKKKRKYPARRLCRYGVLICARNEEKVIGDLVEAFSRQDYPRELISVFVMADNCTDGTARAAERAGARVYIRRDPERTGKGYALSALLSRVEAEYPGEFEGFFVFDADNLPADDYVTRMNELFSLGYPVIQGYRSPKNYGDSWVSAGTGLCLLRECQYLDRPRDGLGLTCTVSGTGFLVSREVLGNQGGWPFFTLTEDAEFSADLLLRNIRVAYCEDGIFYDEQPVTFAQSFTQRRRWVRGYLQVFRKYAKRMIQQALSGSFAAYDLLAASLPAFFLSGAVLGVNLAAALLGNPGGAVSGFLCALGGAYLSMFFIGAVTTLTEWKRIRAGGGKKILYMFTFPVFMLTFFPVAVSALFGSVGWKPIRHTVSRSTFEGQEGENCKHASFMIK